MSLKLNASQYQISGQADFNSNARFNCEVEKFLVSSRVNAVANTINSGCP